MNETNETWMNIGSVAAKLIARIHNSPNADALSSRVLPGTSRAGNSHPDVSGAAKIARG